MKTLAINQQKPADQKWRDADGLIIPYNRVSNFERQSERKLFSLAKGALDLNTRLRAFKSAVKTTVLELYDAFVAEQNGKAGKGNVTLFNFDRSIKVELDVQFSIKLDEKFIDLAKGELEDLIADGLTGSKEWIEPLVMEAFSTNGGKLDYKKILGMKKHASRINDERFTKAMGFIDKSISRPSSKQYFRVYVMDEVGEYQSIKLNFSDVETDD